jgi:hypothetical protein
MDAIIAYVVVARVGANTAGANLANTKLPRFDSKSECAIGNCKIRKILTIIDQGCGIVPRLFDMPKNIATIITNTAAMNTE